MCGRFEQIGYIYFLHVWHVFENKKISVYLLSPTPATNLIRTTLLIFPYCGYNHSPLFLPPVFWLFGSGLFVCLSCFSVRVRSSCSRGFLSLFFFYPLSASHTHTLIISWPVSFSRPIDLPSISLLIHSFFPLPNSTFLLGFCFSGWLTSGRFWLCVLLCIESISVLSILFWSWAFPLPFLSLIMDAFSSYFYSLWLIPTDGLFAVGIYFFCYCQVVWHTEWPLFFRKLFFFLRL